MNLKIEIRDGDTDILSAGFPLLEKTYGIDAFWESVIRICTTNIEAYKKNVNHNPSK